MGVYQYQPMSGSLVPIAGSATDMQGASASAAGTHGLVPQPSAGDENKVLKGDGTWGEASNNFVGTMDEWNALSLSEKILYETADIESEEPIRTYTITYNANGGSGSMDVGVKTQGIPYSIEDNGFIPPSGKIFAEWNTSADGSGTSYHLDQAYTTNANLTLYAIWELAALKFSSDEPFILSVDNPGWNGTLEYTLDEGNTWTTWNGSELSGTATQPIYLRGTGNNRITGTFSAASHIWTFTGKYCTGNIDTLLDYQTVINGQHPTLNDFCYRYMFQNCTSLIVAPSLPAITLTQGCYANMFQGCTSLTTALSLPATILAVGCYANMFQGCTSLIIVPELPATTLVDNCYRSMFTDCTLLKLSATQTPEYPYPYRIPTLDTGTIESGALTDMFTNTGGTFTGTPTINTTYYTDYEPI